MIPKHIPIDRWADFSPDGTYRWSLSRIWDTQREWLVIVGLNPSQADGEKDDPTIRREMGFSYNWGYGGLLKVNLFGRITTNPQKLFSCSDPVGEKNEAHWEREIERVRVQGERLMRTTRYLYTPNVLCAWGARGGYMDQDKMALRWLEARGVNLLCLGTTRGNFPKHPLYLPKNTRVSQYRGPSL